jgi:hypothetical protein
MRLDRREQSPFTFEELYDASDKGDLVDFLRRRIDDSGIIELWASDPEQRAAVEKALGNAVEALRGREIRKTGVGENPLCMVIAVVLEAIQQNFR